ncbi:MAG: hypothetical protein LBC13_03055 [Clostridiales bacterium]|jgi:hypothetical protein|nr:hypothetical protein [Clostridiales bacterium]
MKKTMLGFMIFLTAVLLTAFYSPCDFHSLAAGLSAVYRIYTIEPIGAPVFGVNGRTVYISDDANAHAIGEELTFDGGASDKEKILLRFFVISHHVQELDGVTVITGHSARLPGMGDNIQIAFNGSRYKVGTPLLLGGY